MADYKHDDLNSAYCKGASLEIKPGNVLAVYTDDGPTGICGQSTRTTSPHTYVYLFSTYDEFKMRASDLGRGGKRGKLRYVEVGEYGSEGVFSITDMTSENTPRDKSFQEKLNIFDEYMESVDSQLTSMLDPKDIELLNIFEFKLLDKIEELFGEEDVREP